MVTSHISQDSSRATPIRGIRKQGKLSCWSLGHYLIWTQAKTYSQGKSETDGFKYFVQVAFSHVHTSSADGKVRGTKCERENKCEIENKF